MRKLVFLFILLLTLFSCDSKYIFDEYKAIETPWTKEKGIEFTATAPDTINKYNLFINLRNTNEYKYSNLFIITELDFPNEYKIIDTLEYAMAKPNGEWLGVGFSSLKENKLFYKEYIQFPTLEPFNVKVTHAMRKNGKEKGLDVLEGVTDIGFRIEKIEGKDD